MYDHPLFKDLVKVKVINKHLHRLYMNDKVKKVTPGTMVPFRRVQILSCYLVRTKLYPLEKLVGSSQCKGKLH